MKIFFCIFVFNIFIKSLQPKKYFLPEIKTNKKSAKNIFVSQETKSK